MDLGVVGFPKGIASLTIPVAHPILNYAFLNTYAKIKLGERCVKISVLAKMLALLTVNQNRFKKSYSLVNFCIEFS